MQDDKTQPVQAAFYEEAKLIQAAYWDFEKPWQEYRQRTADRRDAVECGDKEIREKAKRFVTLFNRFKAEHPAEDGMAWGIELSGMPFLYELARATPLRFPPSAASD